MCRRIACQAKLGWDEGGLLHSRFDEQPSFGRYTISHIDDWWQIDVLSSGVSKKCRCFIADTTQDLLLEIDIAACFFIFGLDDFFRVLSAGWLFGLLFEWHRFVI